MSRRARSATVRAVGVACAHGVGDARLLPLEAPAPAGAPHPRFPARRLHRAPPFDPALAADPKSVKLMSRAAKLAVAAARAVEPPVKGRAAAGLFLAVGMAGGEIATLGPLLKASCSGGAIDLAALGRDGLPRLNPLTSFQVLNNMPLCHASIALGIGGPHAALLGVSAGEALDAIDRAAQAALDGEAPWALGGGADAPLDGVNLATDGQRGPAGEAAAIALLACDDPPGAIEWAGLAIGEGSPAELARALDRPPPARWVAVDADAAGRLGGAISVEALYGATGAAAGALAAAIGARALALDPQLGSIGICAVAGEVVRVAVLGRRR